MSNTSAYIYLDSDDRNNKPDTDTTNVNFNVNFRDNSARRVCLSSYDFVIGIDNINSNNNTAYVSDAGMTYPVTLPNGLYDRVELRNQLIVSLGLLGLGAWAIIFQNGHFNIVAPVPVQFITNPLKPNGRDWADMIGMEKETALNTVHNGGLADLTYTNKIYITSPEICQFKIMGDEATSQRINNCLGVVYVNENANYLNEKSDPSPDAVFMHHATRDIRNLKWIMHRVDTDIGTIGIQLLDDRGERIPPEQGKNLRWSIELLVQD